MKPIVSVRFDRGTLDLGTDVGGGGAGDALWDPRSASRRVAAFRFSELAERADARNERIAGDLRDDWPIRRQGNTALDLRPYQEQALASWASFKRQGIAALPTGAGKTRVAIAAMRETGLPTAVLCPTRVLASAWLGELTRWFDEPIGLVGDGERRVERITVLTFESAFRCMDQIGHRFGLLVVDEVHHFASGARIEALEASPAIARLGLSATAPEAGSAGAERLRRLVGPIVFALGYRELAGTHLAPVEVIRLSVSLDADERITYERRTSPFRELSRAFFRTTPGGDVATLLRGLARSPEGLHAVREHAKASDLAMFPRAKQRLVGTLLERHRTDPSIVFTALAEHAYRIAIDNLVPVIAAETSARERVDILSRFRERKVRAIASARVLNEGVDVPEASVAIIVAGTLGAREHIQRIGRVLRPSPGKMALVYELVTLDTADERRAKRRSRDVA